MAFRSLESSQYWWWYYTVRGQEITCLLKHIVERQRFAGLFSVKLDVFRTFIIFDCCTWWQTAELEAIFRAGKSERRKSWICELSLRTISTSFPGLFSIFFAMAPDIMLVREFSSRRGIFSDFPHLHAMCNISHQRSNCTSDHRLFPVLVTAINSTLNNNLQS